MFAQEGTDDFGGAGGFAAGAAEFLLRLAEGKRATVGRLLFGAVNFQIAHHDEVPPANPQINKGIRDEHADGIEHVGIVVAIRHHQ